MNSGSRSFEARGDLRRLGFVVLEAAVDQVVELCGFGEHGRAEQLWWVGVGCAPWARAVSCKLTQKFPPGRARRSRKSHFSRDQGSPMLKRPVRSIAVVLLLSANAACHRGPASAPLTRDDRGEFGANDRFGARILVADQ